MKYLSPILVTVAIVLLLVGGYVGSYLSLSEFRDCSWENQKQPLSIARYYRSDILAYAFKPAAKVESWFSGNDVIVVGPWQWKNELPHLFDSES